MNKYVDVMIRTPLGVTGVFTYSVKEEDEDKVAVGKRAEVDLRGKVIVALIVNTHTNTPSYSTKDIIRVIDGETPIFTDELFELSKWVSEYYVSSLSEVIYSIVSFKNAKLPKMLTLDNEVQNDVKKLTHDQEKAIETIKNTSSKTVYLWGVTGSGKTEVYLEVAKDVISKGKTVIYLVPEVGLTYQLIQYIKAKLPNNNIAVLHSKLTASERLGEWTRIIKGDVDIVVGARSAIFAPLPNLGLIIMDEEHDSSYKSDSFVCYHARNVATKRAKMNDALFILGSATPSLEGYKAFSSGQVELIRLSHRAVETSSVSEIEVCINKGNTIISDKLRFELQKTLDEGKQAILFLNKRGYLHRLVCPECGHVAVCEHCSVPLTYHKDTNMMFCHECGRGYKVRVTCENCGANNVLYQSYGTELVEDEVKSLFPFANVTRIDRDITIKGKKTYEKIITDFYNGKSDILIGTQMIAKGLNFPNVNLVGVVNAMTGYTSSDFRSDEKLCSLLFQVAGRAGRFLDKSKVVIQTDDPTSPPVVAVKSGDIEKFLKDSLEYRRMMDLPPFTHYARVVVRSKKEENARLLSSYIARSINETYKMLKMEGKTGTKELRIVTQGECPIKKLQDDFRYHTVVSSQSVSLIDYAIKNALEGGKKPSNVRIKVDIDPMDLL